MWRPLIPRLAATHMVIAPDLPGIGGYTLCRSRNRAEDRSPAVNLERVM
jgi:hypothetical protein